MSNDQQGSAGQHLCVPSAKQRFSIIYKHLFIHIINKNISIMRRNFLILMLLSLLPLAGWADTEISDVEIRFLNAEGEYVEATGEESAPYTNSADAFTAYKVWGKIGEALEATELTAGTHYTAAFTADEGGTGSMTNYTPGAYTLTVTAADGYTLDGTTTAAFKITKANITATGYEVNEDVDYDGQPHQVIKTAPNVSGIGTLTIKYAITTSGAPAVDDAESWFTDIADATRKVTDHTAAKYKAYFIVTSSNVNVNAFDATLIGEFEIKQVYASITTDPTANTGLVYNADEQELVTAGVAVNGTMEYKLGDSEEWSEDVPKATNANTTGYSVQYRVKASNDNYKDYQPMVLDDEGEETDEPVKLTVRIAKKGLRVTPKAINTFFGDVTTSTTVELSYDGFEGEDDEDAVFDESTHYAPVGQFASTINVSSNIATSASGTANCFVVKNYTNGLEAVNPAGHTASAANYNIILLKNDMTVYAAAVKVELKGAPASAVYGTTQASAYSWEVATSSASSMLNVYVQNGGTQAEPAYGSANTPAATSVLRNASSKFTNMKITREDHSTAVGFYDLALSGSTATSANYRIAVESVVTGDDAPQFKITAASITITPDNLWKYYGAADPAKLTYTVTQTGGAVYALNDAQKTVIEEAITRASGENASDYEVTIPESVKANAAFTGYTITLESGWFSILKRDLYITANDQTLYVGNTEEDHLLQVRGVNYTVEGLQTINGTTDVADVELKFSDAVDVYEEDESEDYEAGQLKAHVGAYTGGIEVVLNNANTLKNNYTVHIENGDLTVIDPSTQIALGATLNNSEAIAAAAAIAGTKDVILSGRTLAAGQWNVLVLPFTITTSQFCEAIGKYAIFNVLTSATGSNIKFGLELTEMKANVPFLVKPQATVTGDITFDDVTVVNGTPSKTVGSATFVGTYDQIAQLAVQEGMYTPQDGQFKPYEEVSKYAFPATMAYLIATSNARITVEEADGSTTAISEINAEGIAIPAEGWYTINGVKLEGAPTQKGIYINNGKKIIVK